MRRRLLIALSIMLFLHPYIEAAHREPKSIDDPVSPVDSEINVTRVSCRGLAVVSTSVEEAVTLDGPGTYTGFYEDVTENRMCYRYYTSGADPQLFHYTDDVLSDGNARGVHDVSALHLTPYKQASQPSTKVTYDWRIWEDTDDSDQVYLVYQSKKIALN